MDICLRKNLPIELVDKIMKKVHLMNFKPCLYAIEHNLTWCRLETITKLKEKKYEYTFMIGDYYGYYHQLEIDVLK